MVAGVLCNNAALPAPEDDEAIGDPIDVALLVAGAKAGIHRDDLLHEMPEEREAAFDPDVNMMATFHRQDDGYRVAVKGAPEAVFAASSRLSTGNGAVAVNAGMREEWLSRNQAMARDGLRVLAVAERRVGDSETDPYQKLRALGLLGFLDPPRHDVRDAIKACQHAGIRVVMVTGDQAETARKVALETRTGQRWSGRCPGRE